MKRPYDLLLTDREPFTYVEKSIVMVRDKTLLVVSEENINPLPVASIFTLFLGPGTSITHEAAILCAKHECHIAHFRGFTNVHSIWLAGRWYNPSPNVKQVLAISDTHKRLLLAKKLLTHKLKREQNNEALLIAKIEQAHSITELLGIEAHLAKVTYAKLAKKYGQSFKRDNSSKDATNQAISLVNNVLYGYITAILTVMGLNPSIAVLHGRTRRGGLAFDLADIFKFELSLQPAFEFPEIDTKTRLFNLAEKLRAHRSRIAKEAITITNELFHL